MIQTILVILAYEMLLVASIPAAIIRFAPDHFSELRLYRLSRTCFTVMLMVGAYLFYVLYGYAGEITLGVSSLIYSTIFAYSVVAATYAEAIFEHSVVEAELREASPRFS